MLREKYKQTNLKRYGFENPLQNLEIREKQKQTCLRKYGLIYPQQDQKIKEKTKQTNLKKYGVENPQQRHLSQLCLGNLNNKDWLYEQHINQNKTLIQIANALGVDGQTVSNYCKKHGIIVKTQKHSYKAIRWLEHIMQVENIFIQHAGNSKEYRIPNTKIRVDGYCENINTIYEFYGDLFHGNPQLYKPNAKTFIHSTPGELYQNTLRREKIIKSLDYGLVTIWESEWDKLKGFQ